MLELIVSKPESYWPPQIEPTQPHPMLVTLALHLLVAALYNYDSIMSGRSEDFVGYLDLSKEDRARYVAEVGERALRKGL